MSGSLSRLSRFPGRRTNLALLAVLAGSFLSGIVGPALGSPSGKWLLVLHGAMGLAAFLLTPWKTRVSQRGFIRHNRGRALSLVMAALAFFVIASGVLHTTGLVTYLGSVTLLWLHVASALALIPLLAWHTWVRRTWPRVPDLARRNLLRLTSLMAAGGIIWWGSEIAVKAARLPGGRRRYTGSHETSSFDPGGVPVTSWLNDRTPSIDAWTLLLADQAGRRRLSLDDLAALSSEEVIADLDCTSGWWSRQRWTGVRLDGLLAAGEARSILIRSATGYARRLPATDLDRLWLATLVGGQPLSPGHGYPARLIAPDRRGFWWVKWVNGIETSPMPWWVQPPYPLS